jgi:hypothetical protein
MRDFPAGLLSRFKKMTDFTVPVTADWQVTGSVSELPLKIRCSLLPVRRLTGLPEPMYVPYVDLSAASVTAQQIPRWHVKSGNAPLFLEFVFPNYYIIRRHVV